MTFLLQNTNVYSTAHSMELREWIGGRTLKNLSTTCRHDWELKFNWNSFTYQITPIQCHWHNNNECKNNHKILLIFLISIFNRSSIKKKSCVNNFSQFVSKVGHNAKFIQLHPFPSFMRFCTLSFLPTVVGDTKLRKEWFFTLLNHTRLCMKTSRGKIFHFKWVN